MARSLNEWVVLALLGEGPQHGFALARQLEPGTDLGRILTVRRPLVYRALDRVVSDDLARPRPTEPGSAGPARTPHRITRRGHHALGHWLVAPVGHVRELRMEFLVKLRLTERRGLDAGALVAAQRDALAPTLDQLGRLGEEPDVVDQWRHHNARAVSEFLSALLAPPAAYSRAGHAMHEGEW